MPPLKIKTKKFDHFDLEDRTSIENLSDLIALFQRDLKREYQELGIEYEPYFFVKNNTGTYGLGVIEVRSSEDVKSWNYKSRKKMKASKGGQGIQSVIVQEGIPTIVTDTENHVAEPTIYMIGEKLAGGFLRVNQRKGPQGNLNAPGVVFSRLCVSDLEVDHQGKLKENVYGWVAKIGLLAVGQEFKDKGIELLL